MYYIGLDVHKKTISFCVKDAAGKIHQEGRIGSTRRELDGWIKTLPQPRMIAMEATIFTGWIYDHLLPHAEKVKVAHPLMLRAIAAAKRKNDQIAMENGKRHDNRAALVAGTQAQTIVAAILNVQTHCRITRVEGVKEAEN